MTLKLVNNLSKVVYNLNNLTDIGNLSLYYKLNVTLPSDIEEGEYTYYLYDGEIEVATGIAQVGDYVPEKMAYTAQTKNNYIQYNG